MKTKKIIYLILIVLCMTSIYLFSNKNSTSSNNTSKKVVNSIVTIYENITNKKINKNQIINKLNYPIRKLAHYSVYFILGIFIYKLILLTKQKHKELITLSICLIYACLDEFHQLYISGRTGQLKDVLIDTLGSLTAITIIYLLDKIRKKNLIKKQKLQ